jgi:hypothetical protein
VSKTNREKRKEAKRLARTKSHRKQVNVNKGGAVPPRILIRESATYH